MSRRTAALTLALGVMALVAPAGAEAQQPTPARARTAVPPSRRPAFSPYLNLLRGGTPTFQNYYGLVRPEIELRSEAYNLQQQVNNQQTTINQEILNENLPATGHVTGNMTHRKYFMTNRGGGGGGRASGTSAAPVRPASGSGASSRFATAAPTAPRTGR